MAGRRSSASTGTSTGTGTSAGPGARARSRVRLACVHRVSAAGALTLITVFLLSSAIVEPAGGPAAVRTLRAAILLAMPVLIACLAAAALTGYRLAGRSRAALIRRKLRRTQALAAVGLVVLVPCALTLGLLAGAGTAGRAAEIIELLAGAASLALLALNFRDGRRVSGR